MCEKKKKDYDRFCIDEILDKVKEKKKKSKKKKKLVATNY